jgi:flagellar operon protein
VSVELNPALLPPGALGSPQTGPGPAASGRAADTGSSSGPSFADVLKETTGSEALRFSKHALERVQRRGIALDPTTLGRLHEGVGRAAGKGSRDSLVLVDGTAFVVSVPNRTVITAVGSEHMREHIFTNIDSAVIA